MQRTVILWLAGREFGRKRLLLSEHTVPEFAWKDMEATELLSQGFRCPDRHSNRVTPEYESRALPVSGENYWFDFCWCPNTSALCPLLLFGFCAVGTYSKH
jgi:hypothetical protein